MTPPLTEWEKGIIDDSLDLLTKLGVKWDVIMPDGTHLYRCTGHRHGYGDHCSSTLNVHGEPKEPSQCKWCEAQCPMGGVCQDCGIKPCEDGRCACLKKDC